jgi:hypothetical protein
MHGLARRRQSVAKVTFLGTDSSSSDVSKETTWTWTTINNRDMRAIGRASPSKHYRTRIINGPKCEARLDGIDQYIPDGKVEQRPIRGNHEGSWSLGKYRIEAVVY